MVHDFKEKLAESQETSKILDDHFSNEFFILPTPLDLDKRGVDRVYIDKEDMKPYTVEYKQDSRCKDTGNAFVEICSVYREECEKQGWAHTCCADYLLYHDVCNNVVYIIPVESMRGVLAGWISSYGRGRAYNKGYHSVGVLVPMQEFTKIAINTVYLEVAT